MAATPFKGTLVMHERATGKPVNMRFSATDVANALVTFDDINSLANLTIPVASGGYVIDDITLSAAGVDTTQLQVRKGTTDTPAIVRDSVLANTTVGATTRCQGLFGRTLEPGATYFFKQLA